MSAKSRRKKLLAYRERQAKREAEAAARLAAESTTKVEPAPVTKADKELIDMEAT